MHYLGEYTIALEEKLLDDEFDKHQSGPAVADPLCLE